MNTELFAAPKTAYLRESAEQIQLRGFRALYTPEQVADFDNRDMGTSIAQIKKWEQETIECTPGGIVDQRMAKIDAANMSLPEKERARRSAKLARQKADALKSGDSAGQVLRVDLLHVKKHRSKKEYSVIDGYTHEALDSGIKDRGTAEGVAVMISADPIYDEVITDPEEAA
jgi:hypothetical protein